MQLTEQQAHKFCQETIELKKHIEAKFLQLGARIKKISDEKLYEPFWDSFGEFCMELDLSPSKASRLKNIYETFVLECEIPEDRLVEAGGWSSLAEILSVARNKQEAKRWVEKASTLSRNDLRIEVKAEKTGNDPAKCVHEDTYTIRVCRECGQKVETVDK